MGRVRPEGYPNDSRKEDFMLRLKAKSTHEAMSLLKKDHDAVKKLFDRFERTEPASERKELVREACAELKVHARVEEEIFYPSLRQKMEDEDGLLDEADEEHHESKILVAELELMNGDEDNYRAKFEVLAEDVRRHIREEESAIFPKARKTAIDFNALGEQMHARKQELMMNGVEPDAEAQMVSRFGVIRQSLSRRAQKTFTPPLRSKGSGRKH
jgi:hemerythrin superfamily protein